MCLRIINNSPEKINEELIVEEKYDSVTKKLVKDILLTLKYQREGEFVLPEDISDEMVYTFPQFNSEFTINLNLSKCFLQIQSFSHKNHCKITR